MSEPLTNAARATRCASNGLSVEHLRELATALVAAPGPASAIGVRRARHGALDLLTQPLDADCEGWHPADLLTGYHAPASWAAFGITAAGVARSVAADATPTVSPSQQAGESRRLAHLVARTGASCTVLGPVASDVGGATGAEPVIEPLVLTATEAVPGLTADACRRVLGLPTAALVAGPVEWATTCWLDRIFARTIARPGSVPPTWRELVAWHPCATTLPRSPDPDELAELVHEQLTAGWEALRRAAAGTEPWLTAAGAAAAEACGADHAAWLDGPAFGRYLLATLPDPEVLGDMLDGLLGPERRAELRRACCQP